MKIIKISAKLPKEVWVDRNNKIAYAKGVKGKLGRLSYNQFRNIFRNQFGRSELDNEDLQITFPDGSILNGPFRQLSEEEIETRINEILGV